MTFWPQNLTTFVDFAMNDLVKVGQSSSHNSQFIHSVWTFVQLRSKIGFGRSQYKKGMKKYEILYDTFFRWIIFELDGCYVRFISIYACVPVVPLASPKKWLKVKCSFRFKKDLFKGSPDSRHFIFEINVG